MIPRRKRVYIIIVIGACVVLALISSLDTSILPPVRKQWAPDTYKWRIVEQQYPLTSFRPLPTGKPKKLPAVQADFPEETPEARAIRLERQATIKDAFARCWTTYKEHAWLHDEVTPISLRSKDEFGGWGATLVDSLDTLWIMGMRDDFNAAVEAIATNVTFETIATGSKPVSVFETSIRFLGGLLAAYDLSGDGRLLSKARDVGDMLYKAFDTPSRLPVPKWDFEAAARGKRQDDPKKLLLAEIGSHAMEFARLSLLTGDPKYYETVARITDMLHGSQMMTKVPGLWPTKIGTTVETMDSGNEYTLGAEADSTFEYTAKMMALLGDQVPEYGVMYTRSMDAAARHLFYRPLLPGNEDVLVSGTVRTEPGGGRSGNNKEHQPPRPRLETSAQHLSCFAGGLLALGGRLTGNETHVGLGRKLALGCAALYGAVPLGIMPEACRITACPEQQEYQELPAPASSCDWETYKGVWHDAVLAKYGRGGGGGGGDDDGSAAATEAIIRDRHLPPSFTEIQARYYLLRPEAVESLFVLYRVTAERDLADRAWDMWKAIDAATRTTTTATNGDKGGTAGAYSATWDVDPGPGKDLPLSDSMESFWLSETLKYFYLLYSEPSLLSLDEWVFNTEAHPFRRMLP